MAARSVLKALHLLSMLMFEDPEQRGMPLSGLAQRLGAPRNTVHNLMQSLVAGGFAAQRAEDSRYAVGPQLLGFLRERELRLALGPAHQAILEEMSKALGEGVTFAILVDGRRRVLARAECGQAVKVDLGALAGENPYEFITGRVLLAFGDAAQRAAVAARWGPPGPTWGDVAPDGLEATLEAIRQRGWASRVRAESGVVSVACPVLLSNQRCVGAVGCYAPQFRCNRQREKQVGRALRGGAQELAEALQERMEL